MLNVPASLLRTMVQFVTSTRGSTAIVETSVHQPRCREPYFWIPCGLPTLLLKHKETV